MPTGIYQKERRRKTLTKEHKRKISEAHAGKIVSTETKLKMSESKKGRHSSPNTEFKRGVFGEKNAAWKGGTWGYLKRKILQESNYTCQICGLTDKEIMEVDHIKSKRFFPELANQLINLMVVCPNC